MGDRELARSLALGRIVIGAVAIALPGLVGRIWLGPEGGRKPAKALMRVFGVRDIALGIVTLDAIDEDRPISHLLQLGVACDSVDLVATALAGPDVPVRHKALVAILAGGAAASGIRLASNLD